MKMLFKYEFRKTWAVKAMVLAVAALMEIIYLSGLAWQGREVVLWGIILLTMTALIGVAVIGIQSVVVLHRDMNTKQGYMLYMTPNSSWKILGAKAIENGVSLLVAGVFFFGLAALDITLLFNRYGTLQDLYDMVERFLEQLGQISLGVGGYASLAANLLISWLSMVFTGFLADVVSSALLNGKKFNGLLSFVLFLAITLLCHYLQQGAVHLMHITPGTVQANLVSCGVALALSVGMYFLTAWIMDRYLSV